MWRLLPLAPAVIVAAVAHAEIYRCGEKGSVFSDTPCGPDAEVVVLGTDNRMVPPSELESTSQSAAHEDAEATPPAPSACRPISSTRLRTLLIRQRVVPGMTQEQVRQALGEPDQTYDQPQPLWTYDLRENRYTFPAITRVQRIYFQDGCVSDILYVAP
ncbi:DUF4124 domain-containing protein [Marinobacteraceae bacterium S3BR75-40.1]